MLADFKIVGSYGVPHPAHPVLLLALYGTIGTLYLTIFDRVGKESLLFLCVVHTKSGANHEVLEWSDAQMYIAE